jgi:hypothetical protein
VAFLVSLASSKKYVLAACQRKKKRLVAEFCHLFSRMPIIKISHPMTIGLPLENFWWQLACC